MPAEPIIAHTCGHPIDTFCLTPEGIAKRSQEPCPNCRDRAYTQAHAAQDVPAPIQPADDESDALKELAKIDQALDAAERLRDTPGDYFPARDAAISRLNKWVTRYPQAAAARTAEQDARRAADEARRQETYEHSFIARGLD